MRDGTASLTRVVFARQSEVVFAVVFDDTFESPAVDGEAVGVDVVGPQVRAFLKFPCLQLVDPVITLGRLTRR